MKGYDLSGLRVLVVDDNDFMGSLISAMLRAFGVGRCDLATDGHSALEMLSTGTTDVVFVDWRMPGMSGIDLVTHIRKGPNSPNPYLPIVMLTGMNEKKHVIAAQKAGVNDFLAKPVTARDLYQRLTNLIENPRPFIRSGAYFGPDRREKPRKAVVADHPKATPQRHQQEEDANDGWYLD